MGKPVATSAGKSTNRLAEIDFLRGVVVLLMVAYHASWNFWYFQLVSYDVRSPLFQLIARLIGSSFLTILGFSLYLGSASYSPKKQLLRGLKLLGWAGVISLVTHLLLAGGVVFGILHLIGVAVIISPLLVKVPRVSGITGLLIITARYIFSGHQITSIYLLPLGLGGTNHYMVDYYPLVPWMGVVLIGIFIGSLLYPKGSRSYNGGEMLARIMALPAFKFFQYLGRHSLIIYLLHQPLLFALTFLVATLTQYVD